MLALDMMTRYGTDGAQKGIDGRWGGTMMGGSRELLWVHGLLALITWLLVVAVLIALARWLWFKGDHEKKGR